MLLLYFIIPRRFLGARNLVLLVSSLVFYAWGEPVTISLMVFSILMNYLLGWMVQKYCDKGQRGRARGFVVSAVVLNLLLLGVFKYADFFLENAAALLGRDIPLLHLALPIGISFYTFQSLSYPVD
ncbi:MAG TPA: MBOAT family protein, partial [Candidatus Caccousia avistercoris]|nr:MBOAT family protein [Candidatus Caccousia avistercoris]